MVAVYSVGDVLKLTAAMHKHMGIEPASGHLAQWAAVHACDGDASENGQGHDFAMSAPNRWGLRKTRSPKGILPDGGSVAPPLASYDDIVAEVETQSVRSAKRLRELFGKWQTDSRLWVEVKHRFLRAGREDEFQDTRSWAGPDDYFAPPADAYVIILVDADGSLRSAWLIPHARLISYVLSNVGRGGVWNYKVSFDPEVPVGIDITDNVATALDSPFPAAISASPMFVRAPQRPHEPG